jgi:hypothetical protein
MNANSVYPNQKKLSSKWTIWKQNEQYNPKDKTEE